MLTPLSRFILLLLLSFSGCLPAFANSAIYAGGPVYKDRNNAIDELKNAGYQRLIVWTLHIQDDGSLGFNGEFPLVKAGKYIGDEKYPAFRHDIASLKTGKTTLNRVEFSLSAAGSGTYDNVKKLIQCKGTHCGTGPDSILYKNFLALKKTFPTVDALNNDDEHTYDVDSSVQFHTLLATMGFTTTIVPYQNQPFWQAFVQGVNKAKPGAVDSLYLQVYDGGSSNNPCDWQLGLPVYGGLWARNDTPQQVQNRMEQWREQCGNTVKGGFMWLYDEFANSNLPAEYATSINNVFPVRQ